MDCVLAADLVPEAAAVSLINVARLFSLLLVGTTRLLDVGTVLAM